MTDLSFIDRITEVSPPLALLLGLIGVGFVLKRTPKYPNWLIPYALVMLGVFVFPRICDRGTIVYNAIDPETLTHIFGGLIGFAAVGLYEVVARKFLDRIGVGKDDDNSKIKDSGSG